MTNSQTTKPIFVLAKCPFCGEAGKEEKVWEGGPPEKLCEYYSCFNPRCPAQPVVTTFEEWNTRYV